MLIYVVTMDLVLISEFVIDIACSLVDIHGRNRGTNEPVPAVCVRNQIHEVDGNRIAAGDDVVTLGVRPNRAGQGQPLPLPQAFIAGKEEGPVFEDRSTDVASKLIALERRNGVGRGHTTRSDGYRVKCVACIEPIVAQVIINLTMELVCARTGGDVDDRA